MASLSTRDKLFLLGILALGAFLRFYDLAALPPGFQFDQAFYMFDVLRLLQGEFHIFFTEPGRSEPLFEYLAMMPAALVGFETPLAIKITAGIIGLLTIFVTYGCARTLFQSTRIGLLAAFFTAISFWHIFYNRYGERIPLTVLTALVALWMFWRALATLRLHHFVLTGIFTGIALYTYPSARLVPIAIVVLTIFYAAMDRARIRTYVQGLFLIGLSAFIVFIPLGLHYLARPIDFFSHSTEVSIFVPHGAISDNWMLELGKNAIKIAGMFFVVGDPGVLRNLPYRPVFDPFAAILFLLGVIVWARDFFVNRRRAIFLGVWLGGALMLSLISDDAPNNGRVMIGSPVILILPAWGASALWDRLRAPMMRRVALAAFALIAFFSTSLTYRDYFDVLANSPETYFAFDGDKVETANWINRAARANQLYLAPLWAQNGTISFLTRYAPVKSFESRDTVILPDNASGKDALFAFPVEQERKAQTLAMRLGSLAMRETAPASNGGTLLLLVRVPASNLPDAGNPLATLARGDAFIQPQTRVNANWGNLIELFGTTLSPEGPGGRNLTTTIFLRALNAMPDDYTFSVKVRDAKNRTWGQVDKWAGTNSFVTSLWSPDEIVIEKFYPGLNACAPAGDYRVTVEAYEPGTMRALGEPVALGKFDAGASDGNRLEDLEPDKSADVRVSERLQLFGTTVWGEDTRAGDEFSVALFWRGNTNGSAEQLALKLRDASGREFPLSERAIKLPTAERGLCTLFDVHAPENVATGKASVLVNNVKAVEINVAK